MRAHHDFTEYNYNNYMLYNNYNNNYNYKINIFCKSVMNLAGRKNFQGMRPAGRGLATPGLHYNISLMLIWENLNMSDNGYLPSWIRTLQLSGVNDLQISKLENLCQYKNIILIF
jgi:hypothetical protein